MASAVDILKPRFLTRIQAMDQNSFFSDTINREAIKAPTDALFQKSLPGQHITLKTILRHSLKTLTSYVYHFEAYFWKLKFQCQKISKCLVRFITVSCTARPVNLITLYHVYTIRSVKKERSIRYNNISI